MFGFKKDKPEKKTDDKKKVNHEDNEGCPFC